MQSKFLAVALVASIFGLAALPVQAALLGSADTSSITEATTEVPLAMYNIQPAGKGTLNTNVRFGGPLIRRYKDYFYFTDTVGLRRQKVGSSTVTTLKRGAAVDLTTGYSGWTGLLVVSNTGKSGAFLYDIPKSQFTTFSPFITKITSADIERTGSVLAMIAKNRDGKQKMYISNVNMASLREYPLPRGAVSCSDITLSPTAAFVALICNFRTYQGVALYPLANRTPGALSRKIISTFSPTSLDWVSESTIAVGGYEPTVSDPFHVAYRSYRVSGNILTSTKLLNINTAALTPDGTIIPVAAQLYRYGKNQFYYMFMYFGTDPNDSSKFVFGSAVGIYNVGTNANSVIVDDGKLNLLTEAVFSAG